MCLTDTLHEEEKDGVIADSHESDLIAEMVIGRRGYGESCLQARKTINLGKMSHNIVLYQEYTRVEESIKHLYNMSVESNITSSIVHVTTLVRIIV